MLNVVHHEKEDFEVAMQDDPAVPQPCLDSNSVSTMVWAHQKLPRKKWGMVDMLKTENSLDARWEEEEKEGDVERE